MGPSIDLDRPGLDRAQSPTGAGRRWVGRGLGPAGPVRIG
jgi:hypothetical protein